MPVRKGLNFVLNYAGTVTGIINFSSFLIFLKLLTGKPSIKSVTKSMLRIGIYIELIMTLPSFQEH